MTYVTSHTCARYDIICFRPKTTLFCYHLYRPMLSLSIIFYVFGSKSALFCSWHLLRKNLRARPRKLKTEMDNVILSMGGGSYNWAMLSSFDFLWKEACDSHVVGFPMWCAICALPARDSHCACEFIYYYFLVEHVNLLLLGNCCLWSPNYDMSFLWIVILL